MKLHLYRDTKKINIYRGTKKMQRIKDTKKLINKRNKDTKIQRYKIKKIQR